MRMGIMWGGRIRTGRAGIHSHGIGERGHDAGPIYRSATIQVDSELAELRLLHLADSALPIGGLAHSFGMESLVAAELLGVRELPEFLRGFLEEAGFLEAVFCRAGFQLGVGTGGEFAREWLALNERLGARKPARESAGSGSLGQNFLAAVGGLGDFALCARGSADLKEAQGLVHHSLAFGLACGVLGFEEDRVV